MVREAGPLASYRPEFNSLLPRNLGHVSETPWASVSFSVKWVDNVTHQSTVLYINTFKQCLAHQGPPQTGTISVIATVEVQSHRGADFY